MSSKLVIDSKLEYGLRWTMLSQTITTVINTVGAVAYTRFLLPEDLGTYGLVSIVYSGLFLLLQAPIHDAVIYFQEEEESYASAAFWLLLGCSLFGIACVLFLADPLSRFYETPLAANLMRVMMLTFFFQTLAVVPAALLLKHFKFAIHEMLHTIRFGLIFVGWISFAISGFGPWSLVMAPLIGSIFWASTTWLAVKFNPTIRPHRDAFQDIIRFSRSLFGSKFSTYLKLNIDNAAVGTLGASALGHYSFAENQSGFAIVALGGPIAQLALPVMAAVQHKHAQVRQIYLDILRLTATLSTPMQIGAFVVADLGVALFFGEQWLAAIPVFRAYLIFRLVDVLLRISDSATSALGRPDIRFAVELGQLPFFIGGTLLALNIWGTLIGVAWTLTFVRLIAGVVYFAATMHLLRISISDILPYLLPSSLAGLLMGIIVYGIHALDLFAWLQVSIQSAFLADTLILLMLILTGIISYFMILFTLDPAGFKAVATIAWQVMLPESARTRLLAIIGPLPTLIRRFLRRMRARIGRN